MAILNLKRVAFLKDRTLGKLSVRGIEEMATLELPWLNNSPQVSCIPAGTYVLEKRNSPKYGDHFWVKNVPGRDMILIHSGNTPKDTHGCILVGLNMADIDHDGLMDVTSSKAALKLLNEILYDNTNTLIIE